VDPDSSVLTIDDNPDIHEDFKKILSRETNAAIALAADEALLLGTCSRRTRIRALSSAVRFR